MIRGAAAELVLTCLDSSGSRGTIALHVSGNGEIAAARSACETLAGLLPLVSLCQVIDYTITYRTYLAPSYPDGSAQEQSRAVLIFETSAEDAYGVVSLPGVAANLVAEDGKIDAAQPLVAALVAALVAGPFVSPLGHDLAELAVAYYEFKP